jgi:hypothetical protein
MWKDIHQPLTEMSTGNIKTNNNASVGESVAGALISYVYVSI